MSAASVYSYKFVGVHSFLIGLFPFYLPVYLWKAGRSITDISYFVALTGLGFCITLWFWDRVRHRINLKGLILLSFFCEILLLGIVFGKENYLVFPMLALANGAYNSFFWTTQRVLFFDTIQLTNSGKKFGNLQIIAALCVKSGIFVGGFMLDTFGMGSVFLFSLLIACLAASSFILKQQVSHLPVGLIQTPSVSLFQLATFTDRFRSRPVFILDGIFLYLESYFWMISLFLIVREGFWELGILVVSLMILFTVLFLVIKNTIDRLPPTFFYKLCIILYALSWLLRGLISKMQSLLWLFIMLVMISFFTSLFRLTFNKRFFDLASSTSRYSYLILKSYYSQGAIAIFFGLVGALLSFFGDPALALQVIYFLAAMLAGGYAIYGFNQRMVTRSKTTDRNPADLGSSSGNTANL